ncbi:MAG: hypothetical protein GX049_07365 [Alcaligenaceae bacterium]|nr:hypothetical protein [Alcaligenaceae bacterium]
MSISPIHLRVNPYVKDETIRPRSGADAEARQESFMEKRLRETGEALERLRAMPLRNSVQMAAEKVEMLKRRLEEIRVNLMFMTPEQAKAYARELKQIAGALSEAARNAGVATGSASGTDTATDVFNSAQALAAALSSRSVAGADADRQAKVDTSTDVTADSSNSTSTAQAGAVAAQAALDKVSTTGDDHLTRSNDAAESREITANGDRKHLRELLKEASKELRAALELLKSRLKEDKEGQRIATELAQAIQDLDEQRMPLDTGGLYDANGAVATISGPVSSLGNISIQA